MLAPNAARGGINAASLRKRALFHSSASAIGTSGVRQGSARGRAFSTSGRPPAQFTSVAYRQRVAALIEIHVMQRDVCDRARLAVSILLGTDPSDVGPVPDLHVQRGR